MRASLTVGVLLLVAGAIVVAQSSLERDRARPHYRAGWELMRVEAWNDAADAFRKAIDIDPQFEDAYYSLGRAQMQLKQFAQAVLSYTKCRELYEAQAGRLFANRQDTQRFRHDRLAEIDELIRQLQQGPQTVTVQDRLRQLQEQRRQTSEYLSRGNNVTIERTIPSFVSLALGSAYFRMGNMAEAETAYKAAIRADGKSGEALSNLAVVYMETGRLEEAEKALAAAEKTGFRVNPQLKEEIKNRRKAGSTM
jgi:tetratricopeptide (TPR) repeat protein